MGSPAEPPLLALHGAAKIYGEGASEVRALDGVDLCVQRGELVAITGPSGSGKSTAMSVLGCLDQLSAGSYELEGTPIEGLEPNVLAALRNQRFGFVFQQFNLLPRTSALENVGLPLLYAGMGRHQREQAARRALSAVGLADREQARPNQLSGGQQQRVALARAIVNEPDILLADEPTGNLDSKTGSEIMQLIRGLNHERGITVLMVTHDPNCAALAPRQIRFLDGRIAADEHRS
ncbi:MAG TPA: ABC transporter ATP-binding protein [Polyangiales bacterium]